MNKEIKIPPAKMSQKVQEDICDALENIAMNAEQISEMCYEAGFKNGYMRAYKKFHHPHE